MANLKLQHNELSVQTKLSMRQRIVSSFGIAFYLIVLFLLAIFSDKSYFNSDGTLWMSFVSEQVRIATCSLMLVWLLPLVIICAKEITNIFFAYKKIAISLVILSMVFLVYGPALTNFLSLYQIVPINQGSGVSNTGIAGLNATTIYCIVLACGIVFTVLINTILLIVYHHLTFKNWVILNLLAGIISGFYLALLFFVFNWGWITLLFLLLIVFGNDSFAYFGGVLFGKHKMAPKISPKKTWEGFFSGLLLTTGLMLLMILGFKYVLNPTNILFNIFGWQVTPERTSTILDEISNNQLGDMYGWWLIITAIIILLGIIGVLGDLSFSWFKRKYHIKDYGTLIPGHGGIIDRIDSHSFVLSTFFIVSLLLALFTGHVSINANLF